MRFWDGSELPAAGDGTGPTLVVRDPVALSYLLREPNELGLGRAWVAGALEVDGELDQMLELRSTIRDVSLTFHERLTAATCLIRIGGGRALRRPPALSTEAAMAGRRHSLRRDRSAIQHHYDVPSSFYRLVLGPTMVYSCAYFEQPDEALELAQARKLELICRKLQLRPGDRLLDVGCGWGSLIIHAAVRHGVNALGVTLSEAQAAFAREQIRALGLADRCEVRVADYREVDDGPFDAIASVGMYEHVGRGQLDTYVAKVRSLLRPGGAFLNHGITRLTPRQRNERSFIARFVFPDGELHPVTEVLSSTERAGLEIRDLESLREHYALTLGRWLANLEDNRAAAIEAAGSERERIWRLYMTGAAVGFARGELSVFQTLAIRGGDRHRLPLSRARLTESGAARPSARSEPLPDERSPVRAI